MEVDDFYKLSEHLCDRKNKFIGFRHIRNILDSITDDVYDHCELDRPPPNILRKVIFNEFTGLTTKEKQSIVGRYTGKVKLTLLEIHNAMLYINNRGNKITISSLADELNRSTRTIHRHLNNDLKEIKTELNEKNKTHS
jgi:predicted HTH transcriptional regulator